MCCIQAELSCVHLCQGKFFYYSLFLLVCQVKLANIRRRNKEKQTHHSSQHPIFSLIYVSNTVTDVNKSKVNSSEPRSPLKIRLKIVAAQLVMKFLCSFRARWRALLCFHSTLSAYEAKAKWWWEEKSGNHSGPDQAPAKRRLARRLPVIPISPAFTRTEIELNPLLLGPPHAFTWEFLTIVVKQAVNKGTHCSTDTHLPLPLSPVRESRAEILQILCSLVEIFCRCPLSPCARFYFVGVFRCRRSCMEKPCQTKAFWFRFLLHLEINDTNKTTQNFGSLIGHICFSPSNFQ